MNYEEVVKELREIRKLLEPKPAPPKQEPKGLINEFKAFLKQYRVMGMAVAFILGLYLGALVKALVDDLLMPIISLFTPEVEWENILIGPFRIGHFIGSLITLIMVAFVIFILVKLTK